MADSEQHRRPEVEGYVVYALTDPRDGSIRYVGRTSNLAGRLASHESEGRRVVEHPSENPRKCEWLRELRREGLRFGVCILQRSRNGAENCHDEAQWIVSGLYLKWPLTNRPLAKHVRLVAAASAESAQ